MSIYVSFSCYLVEAEDVKKLASVLNVLASEKQKAQKVKIRRRLVTIEGVIRLRANQIQTRKTERDIIG